MLANGKLRFATKVLVVAGTLALVSLLNADAVMATPPAPAPAPAAPPQLGGDDVTALKQLSDGLAFFALMTCVVGILVSAVLWAMGSKGQNPGTELAGKKGMIVCCTAAFFLGAVGPWIGFLDNAAKGIDGTDRPAQIIQNDPPPGG